MSDYLHYLQSIQSTYSEARMHKYFSYNFESFVHAGSRVLELGPGTGAFLSFCEARGASTFTIIDRDQAVLDYIGQRFPLATRHLCAVEDLSTLDQSLAQYDVIFVLQVFEHVKKDSLPRALEVLYRHLAPGGSLLITVPNGGNPLSIVERYSDITHENLFSENSLRQLCSMAGIPATQVAVMGYCIPLGSVFDCVRIPIQWLLHLLLRVLLIANGGVWFRILHPNITLRVTRPS